MWKILFLMLNSKIGRQYQSWMLPLHTYLPEGWVSSSKSKELSRWEFQVSFFFSIICNWKIRTWTKMPRKYLISHLKTLIDWFERNSNNINWLFFCPHLRSMLKMLDGGGEIMNGFFQIFAGGGSPWKWSSFEEFEVINSQFLIHHKKSSSTEFKICDPFFTSYFDSKFHGIRVFPEFIDIISKALGRWGIYLSRNRASHWVILCIWGKGLQK